VPAPVVAPVQSAPISFPPVPAPKQLTEDELHVERLKQFFAANRPENVPRVPELYAKMGKQIWAAMELKYPGKTAAYTEVWHRLDTSAVCTVIAFPYFLFQA
jgi:hypothetical protein